VEIQAVLRLCELPNERDEVRSSGSDWILCCECPCRDLSADFLRSTRNNLFFRTWIQTQL